METNVSDAGGQADPNVSDLGGDKTNDESDLQDNPTGNPGDTVRYETYKKILGEKKKEREIRLETEKKLSEYQQREKEEQEKKLLQEKNFEELLKHRDEELAEKERVRKELEEKLSQKDRVILDSVKMDAFINAIGGLSKEYWGLVDLDKVQSNEDGKIDETSLQLYAKNFKTTYHKIVGSPTGVKLPNGDPPKTSETLTYEQWKSIGNAKEMKRRWKDVQR